MLVVLFSSLKKMFGAAWIHTVYCDTELLRTSNPVSTKYLFQTIIVSDRSKTQDIKEYVIFVIGFGF